MDHEHHHHDSTEKECCHSHHEFTHEQNVPKDQWERVHEKILEYKPLAVILVFCLLLSVIPVFFGHDSLRDGMYSFMGYFFSFLALFKFFDLKGFVEGFETYDLVTRLWRPYGYMYPFFELALGLLYLNQLHLNWVNPFTVLLMSISGVGVMISVFSGRKIKCACLGTALNVPLGTISILENLGMALMAIYMLYINA